MSPPLSELVLMLGMAVAAGLGGCFAVMRKMSLASDAILHVALPGIRLALLFHVQPGERHRPRVARPGADVRNPRLASEPVVPADVRRDRRSRPSVSRHPAHGSLIIIPAATAKHLARGLDSMLALAVGIAVVATLAGMALAWLIQRETGPVIIAVAAAIFFVSLLRRPA